jgi:tetratricopeptide (TPR) repeat protein
MQEFLYARAHQYFMAGDLDKAENLFRVLCLIDGSNYDFWLGYGICLRMKERLEHALVAFDTAALLQPTSAAPHFHRLELFIRQDKWQLAEETLAEFDRVSNEETPKEMEIELEQFRKAIEIRKTA